MFFGSGINNFGVQEILQALVEWAPPPQPRDGGARIVQPAEARVHRLRVQDPGEHGSASIATASRSSASARAATRPAMKVRHLRIGREMKLGNVLTFMANERVASEDAVAGDIIGIHNHGQLQIGDTLTEGEALGFKGIPYFAPELFRVARPRDPFKAKQLQKGLQELGEEGAIQVFETAHGQHAAAGRRRASCSSKSSRTAWRANTRSTRSTTTANISTARWLTFPDEATRRNFESEQRGVAGDRRRRQSGVPRDQQVQPAGHDGALAEGRLPRDARARGAARPRLGRAASRASPRHASVTRAAGATTAALAHGAVGQKPFGRVPEQVSRDHGPRDEDDDHGRHLACRGARAATPEMRRRRFARWRRQAARVPPEVRVPRFRAR